MTNDQHADLMTVLSEIRDLLCVLATAIEEPEPETPGCDHPEEHRTDFSTPGRVHWVCGDCGYVEQRGGTTAPVNPPA